MFLLKNLKCQKLSRIETKYVRFVSIAQSTFLSSSNYPGTKDKPQTLISVNESFGQPTSWTHPHLIKAGELVPCVKVDEFQQRRTRLMQCIQNFAAQNDEPYTLRSHITIIPSSIKKYMSEKIPYVFRQNSDFYYLTGCLEPDTVLMMIINEKGDVKSTLFMRPKDKHAELWDGPRTGVDNSIEMFGVDEAFSVDLIKNEVCRRMTDKPLIWYNADSSDQIGLTEDLKNIAGGVGQLKSPTNIIQSRRLFKSPSEIALMRKTCDIASDSINETMRDTIPGHSEHHIFAMIDYKCRMRNASHLAYPPVVASGTNATTIHYINNTQVAKSGELILMDAGCEYGGYTSDITRTWPVNGEFSQAQKVLYDVLLQLQKELIENLLKEGGDTLDNLFDTMCLKLGKYLKEVGLVSKHISKDIDLAKAGYQFCPHHVSHYLGLDVHDTPLMPRNMRLLPGMVCTVEPGIYIGVDRTDVPKEFRGIGLRIEDDILITSDGSMEVLTSRCLKERSSLENLKHELL